MPLWIDQILGPNASLERPDTRVNCFKHPIYLGQMPFWIDFGGCDILMIYDFDYKNHIMSL